MKLNWNRNLALSAAGLLVLGAAGGAGAMALTRPTVEMAPTVPTAIARLSGSDGVISIRGRVAEVYGDHFVVVDQSGRALVDAGPDGDAMRTGSAVLVQGRFDNGQLHARYLVDASGTVREVGPHGPRGVGGPPPPPGQTGAVQPDAIVPPPPPSARTGAPEQK